MTLVETAEATPVASTTAVAAAVAVGPNPNSSSNSSFSTAVAGLQLGWDATSLEALDKCPRLYQLSIIEGYQTPFTSPNLTFGTVFHSATELYSLTRAAGQDHDQALLAALRHTIVATWDFKLGRPWASDEPTKTRDTLFRTIVWYLDHFRDESLETLILANGKPAVELSFRFDSGLKTQDGESIQLCGHIDRVVTWNDEIWITDKKTSRYDLDENYFKQFLPHNQMTLYSIAGFVTLNKDIDGLIIDGCQILVGGSRFLRKQIPMTPNILEEWMTDFAIKVKEAEGYATQAYWPMRRSSCGFGRMQCQFRPVCSSDPTIRQTLLDSAYSRRTWDPLQPR